MDSSNQSIDPDRSVELRTTLADGPPVPTFVVSAVLAQEGDNELVVTTTQANVRLTTSTNSPTTDHETSMLVPPIPAPIPTAYPGIHLDTRYDLIDRKNPEKTEKTF